MIGTAIFTICKEIASFSTNNYNVSMLQGFVQHSSHLQRKLLSGIIIIIIIIIIIHTTYSHVIPCPTIVIECATEHKKELIQSSVN